jgi:hypothetical protein
MPHRKTKTTAKHKGAAALRAKATRRQWASGAHLPPTDAQRGKGENSAHMWMWPWRTAHTAASSEQDAQALHVIIHVCISEKWSL